MPVLASIVLSYLLGSIPFGYLIVSASTGDDIRETGSGGTGATNVSRRAGKVAGILTLIFDAAKGAAAVLLAQLLLGETGNAAWWTVLSGIVAILGHVFPIWLGFSGGKGVATGVGVFTVLAPLPLLFAGVLFVIVVFFSRYVSLGSILAAAAIPAFVWTQNLIRPTPNFLPILLGTLFGAIIIIFAHRKNIVRLLNHTENQFR